MLKVDKSVYLHKKQVEMHDFLMYFHEKKLLYNLKLLYCVSEK